MTDFAGILRSIDSVVTITDTSDDPKRSTCTYKINDKVTAIIFRGIDGAIQFCDTYVKPHQTLDAEKLITRASGEFNSHHNEFQNSDFSLILVAFVGTRNPVIFGLWFDQNGHHAQLMLDYVIVSTVQDDLVKYIVSKVYSSHMLIGELQRLMGYVVLQCIKIFPNIGYNFEITTFTDEHVKTLTSGETKDLFHKAEKIDHKLKKIFGDFFINDEVKK